MSASSRLQLAALPFLSVLAAGCSHGSSHRSPAPPPPIALEEAVAAHPLLRDPVAPRPSSHERDSLEHYDLDLDGLLYATGWNDAHNHFVALAADRAGFDHSLHIDVAGDFRYVDALWDVDAGIAGNRRIVLDGKRLDLLLEIAVFFTLYDFHIVDRDPVDAIDEIVFLHHEWLGPTTDGFLYCYCELYPEEARYADDLFVDLVAAMLYSEFGHVFFRHLLEELRWHAWLELPQLFAGDLEDEATHLSGMLLAKTGSDLGLALDLVDIAAFAEEQRWDRGFTFWNALASGFQSRRPGPGRASPIERKDLVYDGHHRYQHYWGLDH